MPVPEYPEWVWTQHPSHAPPRGPRDPPNPGINVPDPSVYLGLDYSGNRALCPRIISALF